MKNSRMVSSAVSMVFYFFVAVLSTWIFPSQSQAAGGNLAKVYFKNLKEGQTIPTKFKVEMGVDGMSLLKAGEAIDDKTKGHHHLIVNGDSISDGVVIPADATHLHFGKGQTEAELNLTPGDYTLTLQFADGAHRSYGKKLSSTVKVHVK